MKLNINNDISIEKWKELELVSETASFFQSNNCFHFFNSLSFLDEFAFAVEAENKLKALICGYVIADGGVLKRALSKRAIIPGGLMLHPECTTEEIKFLLDSVNKELKAKAIYTEFRNYFDFSLQKKSFEECGFIYKKHLNFQVFTPDIETASKNLSSTKRRDVKLSKKEGATITDTKYKKDIDDYFELIHQLYKTKIKTPVFPYEFFQKIIQLPEAHLFAIHINNELIGGSLCVEMNGNVLYEWFVCGKDGQFKNVFPSTLATWAAIEFAAQNGYKYFDMMGAGKPDEGYGVRDFKAKFGGELVEHGRFLCINNPLLYNIGKKAIQIIKKKK